MAKAPPDRYRTAKAFAADLTAWIEGDEIKAEQRPAKSRRGLFLVGGGVAAGAALIAGLVLMALRRQGSETAAELDRADRSMKERGFGEALEVYARIAALDPSNARALAGKEEALVRIRELVAPPKSVAAQPSAMQEGEGLKILACTAGRTTVQSTVGAPWDGDWSGNAQLFWTGGNPNTMLRLQFRAPLAGRGTLYLGLTRAPDYGVFRISVNKKVIDSELDLYGPRVRHLDREYAGVDFLAGDNELEVEIMGVNREAKGPEVMQFGLDYVRVLTSKSAYVGK